jgi:hypothetical protein
MIQVTLNDEPVFGRENNEIRIRDSLGDLSALLDMKNKTG